ncbi:unnamed protein product [Blepharisma stoltei]|uniref:PWWP domain-containing protein n=1 Tax=Blepharisma stoltei TaxID=1481888 RepID=A0AAU9J7C0_9CILI|nr:unnamed protein product [Blepharisma stoltei]
MDKCFAKGQLVWAKLKGYPWWPGVVTQAEEPGYGVNAAEKSRFVKVNFIGENSHSNLSENNVCDYQENYAKYCFAKKKFLKKSIEAANDILNGKISISELPKINEYINKSLFPPKINLNEIKKKSYVKELKDIEESLDSKETKNNRCLKLTEIPYTLNKVMKLQKILTGYTSANTSKMNIDKMTLHNLYEHFSYLLNSDPTSSALNSSEILKAIKHFHEEFIDNDDHILSELAKLAHKLYLFWKRKIISHVLGNSDYKEPEKKSAEAPVKKINESPVKNIHEVPVKKAHESPMKKIPESLKKTKSTIMVPELQISSSESTTSSSPEISCQYYNTEDEFCPDPNLKQKTCEQIVRVLTTNGFETNKAGELAACIERKLRRKDPSMKCQYLKFFNLMIEDIKLLSKENYERSEEIKKKNNCVV